MSKTAVNPSPERIELGKRIKILRNMSQLSQESVAEMMSKVRTTLYYWESALTKAIKPDDLKSLLEVMENQVGIQCSYEWLTKGEGSGPQFLHSDPLRQSLPAAGEENLEDSNISKELSLFLKQNPKAIHWVIPDDSMEPLFTKDEVVAGISAYKKDITSLLGMNCIILTKNGNKYVRRLLKGSLPNHYNLVALNPSANSDALLDIEIVSAAAIIWTRKRKPE